MHYNETPPGLPPLIDDPTGLPPPGDARRETLRQRADRLAQEAEELSNDLERESIDPTKLRVENDIAQSFVPDFETENWNLPVSNARPGYVYKWVFRDPGGRFGNTFVMRERIPVNGPWEVVSGTGPECPEAREHLFADGTRVVGDVLLMRIRKDFHTMLLRRQAARTERFEHSITSRLEELGERARGRGVKVHTDASTMNPKMAERLFNSTHAQKLVERTVDQMIREGRMPGVPAPGRG